MTENAEVDLRHKTIKKQSKSVDLGTELNTWEAAAQQRRIIAGDGIRHASSHGYA